MLRKQLNDLETFLARVGFSLLPDVGNYGDYQIPKVGSIAFSSSSLWSVTYFSAEASRVPFLSTARQFFSSQVLRALKSSCLPLNSSSHLSVSGLVYFTSLSFWFFPFFHSFFFPSYSTFCRGWPTPATPLWRHVAWDPAQRPSALAPLGPSALAAGIHTPSIPTYNKLSFQFLPIVIDRKSVV